MHVLNSATVQRPNKAVERTGHTTGFFYTRMPVACGPPLTPAVRLLNQQGKSNVPPVQVVPLLCNKFKLDVSFPKPLFIFLVLF